MDLLYETAVRVGSLIDGARRASRGVEKCGKLLHKLRSRHDDGTSRIVRASLQIGLNVGAIPDHPYTWSHVSNLLDQGDGIVRSEVEVNEDKRTIHLRQMMPHRSR